MASILKFHLRDRTQNEVKVIPEGRVVAMKHVDLEVVADLMRLFRKMDDPEYRKAYAIAKGDRHSTSEASVCCTEKN
jgi:hypothetical protein